MPKNLAADIKSRDARVWKLARQLAHESPFATFEESPVSIDNAGVLVAAVDRIEAVKWPNGSQDDDKEGSAFLYGVAVGLEMAGRGVR